MGRWVRPFQNWHFWSKWHCPKDLEGMWVGMNKGHHGGVPGRPHELHIWCKGAQNDRKVTQKGEK